MQYKIFISSKTNLGTKMKAPSELTQARITLAAYHRKLARLELEIIEQRRKVREQKQLAKNLEKKNK
jgi:hypothetical protein